MEIEKFKEIMKTNDSNDKEFLLSEIGKLIQNIDLKSHQNSYNLNEIKNRFGSFSEVNNFKIGDFVIWKDGLKNRLVPEYGQPVIVMDIFSESIITQTDEAGSPYFREPLDLIIGLIDEDDEFHCFHFDKRRFQIYKQ